MDIVLFLVSLGVILLGCELFTNSVEWTGKRFRLSQGAVGSVLAAVGTALPETVVPVLGGPLNLAFKGLVPAMV